MIYPSDLHEYAREHQLLWAFNCSNQAFFVKDILEWDEDAEEYIRKNLPSDIVWLMLQIVDNTLWFILYETILIFVSQDEISGWAEDLFTARKSAINLLSVIAMSKVMTLDIFVSYTFFWVLLICLHIVPWIICWTY